jgi:two-component system sensor histidine kinase KdpD
MKYSPEGSPIEIRARRLDLDRDRPVPMIALEVFDRGMGIPPQDLGRVFDKFYRVQRPETIGGTGLGLSISRGFVEAHGGRIWAEARPGGGTVVTIALPLDGSPPVDRD